MAWAPCSRQRAPVMSILSLTMWRQAPSMMPVAMSHPLVRAVW